MDEVIKLLSDILGNDLDKDGDLVLYGDDDSDNNEWVNRLRSALVKAQKRMYDDGGRYTNGGHDLDLEVGNALRPIMEKWAEEGYNMRDIAHVIHLAVIDIESMYFIFRQHRKVKEGLEKEKEDA
jgi:hypothetical protein